MFSFGFDYNDRGPIIVPHSLKRLRGRIDVIMMDNHDLGSMKMVMIDDPNATLANFGLTSPVGYFNEQDGGYPNGVAFIAASEIFVKYLSSERDSMSEGANVASSSTSWISEVSSARLIQDVSSFWKTLSTFDKSSVRPDILIMVEFK